MILKKDSAGETEAWRKRLGFLQQENITQKTRLTQVLKINKAEAGDKELFEQAEQYQNYFLQLDEAFLLMRKDISEFEKLAGNNMPASKNYTNPLHHRQKKLRKELKKLEINFQKIKSGFDSFLEAQDSIQQYSWLK